METISEISDHFSQFCFLSSIADELKENGKMRDLLKCSSRSFVADLIQVDWDEIVARGTDDINKKNFHLFIINLTEL